MSKFGKDVGIEVLATADDISRSARAISDPCAIKFSDSGRRKKAELPADVLFKPLLGQTPVLRFRRLLVFAVDYVPVRASVLPSV